MERLHARRSASGTGNEDMNNMCDGLLVRSSKATEINYSSLDVFSHLARFLVYGTSEMGCISRRLVRSWHTRREKHSRCSMFKTNSDRYEQIQYSTAFSPPRHLAKLQPHAIRCFGRNEPSRIVRVPFANKLDVVTPDQRGYKALQLRTRESRK